MYTVDGLDPNGLGGEVAAGGGGAGGGVGAAGALVAGAVAAAVGMGLGEAALRPGAADGPVAVGVPLGVMKPSTVGAARPTAADGDAPRSPEADGAREAGLVSRTAANAIEMVPSASNPTSHGRPRWRRNVKLSVTDAWALVRVASRSP